jgi:hypothetical protein
MRLIQWESDRIIAIELRRVSNDTYFGSIEWELPVWFGWRSIGSWG